MKKIIHIKSNISVQTDKINLNYAHARAAVVYRRILGRECGLNHQKVRPPSVSNISPSSTFCGGSNTKGSSVVFLFNFQPQELVAVLDLVKLRDSKQVKYSVSRRR